MVICLNTSCDVNQCVPARVQRHKIEATCAQKGKLRPSQMLSHAGHLSVPTATSRMYRNIRLTVESPDIFRRSSVIAKNHENLYKIVLSITPQLLKLSLFPSNQILFKICDCQKLADRKIRPRPLFLFSNFYTCLKSFKATIYHFFVLNNKHSR